MGSKCSDSDELAEASYWTNVTQIHFFKALLGNYENRLSIPTKFVSNFKGKLSDKVFLRGPSGNTWPIGLNKVNNTLYFEDGWSYFIQDHDLKEADFLVFRYTGDSTFDVLMFDLNFCEKESSYFVKSEGISSRTKCDCCKLKERKMDELMRIGDDESNLSKKIRLGDDDCSLKHNRRSDSVQVEENSREGRTGEADETYMNVNCGMPTDALPSYVDEAFTYKYYLISRRRPVTEAEREKALKAAHAVKTELTEPGFIQVMRPTSVYKRFRMRIPSTWAKEHLPHKTQDVILSVSTNTNTWVAEIQFGETDIELCKGWSRFAMENNLEDGDACLFKVSQGGRWSKDIIVMNVSIFRVIEQVVPLTKFVPNPPDSVGIMKQKERSGDAYVHSKLKAHLVINIKKPDTMIHDNDNYTDGRSSRKALPTYVDHTLKYPYYLISGRRPVTEAEKDKALKAAKAFELTKPGFIQVMKLCNVYKGYLLLNFPKEWARQYLPYLSQDVILCVSGNANKWICRFKSIDGKARLEKGWSTFVMDNNLEEGDVCVFELCQGGQGSCDIIIITVSIFRVVDQVVPLTRLKRRCP